MAFPSKSKAASLAAVLVAFAVLLLPFARGSDGVESSAIAAARTAAQPAHTPAAQDDFEDLLDKARLYLQRRNYEEALKLFKRANSMKANNCAECLWGMAQAYSKLGATKNVLETCDRLVQVATDDLPLAAKAHNLKGITLSSLAMEKRETGDPKRLAEAEVAFRAALAADSELHIAHYNLGVTLIRLNREAEGIQELRTYLDADDDSGTAEQAQKIIDNPRRARENFAPDFSITTAEGEFISSDDLRGKVVVVDFWGTWCPPCVESVPALVSLNKRFSKEPFVLLSVSSDSDAEAWSEFIQKNKMTWAQYLDRTDKVQRAFQVQSFPTYIIIDHEGVIRYRSSGYSLYTEGEVAGAVKKALKVLANAGSQPKPQVAAAPEAQRSREPARRQSSSPSQPASPPAPVQASSAAPPVAPEKKETELPALEVEISNGETMEAGGMKLTRYVLSVKNWKDYPDFLFAPVPELPPCGLNNPATRIQIVIWSEAGDPLTTYCSLPEPGLLRRLWVMVREGEASLTRIYVTLEDRRTHRTAKTGLLTLPNPRSP